ncbi:MAG: DNA polymerase [Acidimicrobiales bacterium]
MTSHTSDRPVQPASQPVFLLDGSSLVYRAFFALPQDMATGGGMVTNAVYGFVSMVASMLRDYRPDAMAIAFDRPEPTFRSNIVTEYKANRAETPEILLPQFELVRRFAQLLGVPQLDQAGFEADDILATLATQGREAYRNVVVVTGDRDAFQLVEDPYVKVMYTRKGISDVVLYDEAGILDRSGVPPALYPFMAALRGDPSDNLAGVAGVGEKTAARLAMTYRDPETLFSSLGELTPKLRSSLDGARDRILKNLEATLLVHDLALDTSIASMTLGGFDFAGLRSFLVDELEMRTIWNRLEAVLGSLGDDARVSADLPDGGSLGMAPSLPEGPLRYRLHVADGANDPAALALLHDSIARMQDASAASADGHDDGMMLVAGVWYSASQVLSGAGDGQGVIGVEHGSASLETGGDGDGSSSRNPGQAGAAGGSGAAGKGEGHGAAGGSGRTAGGVNVDGPGGVLSGVIMGYWESISSVCDLVYIEKTVLLAMAVQGILRGAGFTLIGDHGSGHGEGAHGGSVYSDGFASDTGRGHAAVGSEGAGSTVDESVAASTSEGTPGGARRGVLVTSGARMLIRALLAEGVDIEGLRMDCEIAGYLLDPGTGRYSVGDLCDRYLGGRPEIVAAPDHEDMGTRQGTVGHEGIPAQHEGISGHEGIVVDEGILGHQNITERGASRDAGTTVDEHRAVLAAADDALCSGLLCHTCEQMLAQEGLSRLYDEIELPLIGVLARMEHAGIAVDRGRMEEISRELRNRAAELADRVQEFAGVRFNVNSTKDLREILYGEDHLHLKPGRKTKTGYSTDARTLEKLRTAHPMVEILLEYREVEKLRSTYGDRILQEIAEDGRIHATFRQTATRTGRLSSDRPNLHNIPVRTDIGKQIREAFIPADGYYFIVADYDQIELRIIAHLAADPGLLAAFGEGRDVHAEIAARVYAIPSVEVTTVQRNRAKMVSYGLAYGMETFGLADRLGITNAEAQAILDAYFAAFPGLHAYMDGAVKEARRHGYTRTLMGRRRPLPELRSSNRVVRQAAERQAMNAGVQGLAADLFKLALVRLAKSLQDVSALSRIVLQVHDEVLIEAHPSDGELQELVRSVLAGVGDEVGLSVPLNVSIGAGSSWAAAKHG